MTGRHSRLLAIAVALLVTLAPIGMAQEPDAGDPADHTQVLSTNPLTTILLSWYNGEYERQLTRRVTLGLSGSRLSWGGRGAFVSVNAAFRYYPSGTAFRGFYLGPRVGLFHYPAADGVMDLDGGSGPFLGVGLELGRAWLLGAERHLSVSVGGGATRVFNGEAIPMIRIVNVGWAF